MTFLAPLYLFAGAAAALGVLLLHLIVTREPRSHPLPTARFAPDVTALARPRVVKPRDLLLLALRVLLVLLIGIALAQPIIRPPRRAVSRVVLADRSWAVLDSAEVRDSVGRIAQSGDTVIPFDSSGVSPALILGLRAATALRQGSDSLELVVVSPLLAGQLDDATDSIRALWPARIRLVRVAGRAGSDAAPVVEFDGPSDDPLRLALESRIAPGAASVRVVRGQLGAGDSAFAGVLVHWPAIGDRGSEGSAVGSRRSAIDAVMTDGVVVVAPWARPESPRDSGIVIARWMDGAPAAIERATAAGCVRTVMIPVPARGDLMLTPRFRRLAERLTDPCGPRRDFTPAGAERMASLAGRDLPAVAAASVLPAAELRRSRLAAWLLLAAALLAGVEVWLRRTARRSET